MYHRHDEKEPYWEPGEVRSGAGVRSSGVNEESSGSSETWAAAPCRLCRRRDVKGGGAKPVLGNAITDEGYSNSQCIAAVVLRA